MEGVVNKFCCDATILAKAYLFEKYIDKYKNRISDLCERSQISTSFINSHPEYDWNWNLLSYNFYISSQLVKSNPDKSWNWYEMSLNPNLTIEFIEAHPNKPWDWDYISHNYFTYDDIENVIKDVRSTMRKNLLTISHKRF